MVIQQVKQEVTNKQTNNRLFLNCNDFFYFP